MFSTHTSPRRFEVPNVVPGDVRRGDHLRQPEQRIVRVRRLLREHVDAGGTQATGCQRRGERRLVHDPTPRDVDQHGGWLQQRQLRGIDQVPCLGVERDVIEM